MAQVYRFSDFRNAARRVAFTRHELNRILSLYSRRVIRGEWNDYAIDFRPGMAIFTIFAGRGHKARFVIAKTEVKPQRPQNFVVFSGQRSMKHGGSIDEVLSVFDRRPELVDQRR